MSKQSIDPATLEALAKLRKWYEMMPNLGEYISEISVYVEWNGDTRVHFLEDMVEIEHGDFH